MKVSLKKMGHIKKKSIIFCALVLILPIFHFLFFILLGNGGTLVLAFQELSMDTGAFEWVGLKNFLVMPRILMSPSNEFPIALRNSLLFFGLNNFIILPLSLFCAILCYRRIFMGNFFRVVFFLPCIISPVIIAMVFTFSFDSSVGFVNKILESLGMGAKIPIFGWLADEGTAMPLLLFYCVWVGIGGSIILFTGAITRIPTEIYELNRLYGLGLVGETFRVILPLIGSTISILFLQGLGVILGFYMPSLLVTGGQAKTTTIGLFLIQLVRGSQSNYGFAAALTIVSTFIMSPIILFCRWGLRRLLPDYEY